MSVQMTIRLGDDLAAFVDDAARAGEGSRAEIISRALQREVRRRAAERDAEIYATIRYAAEDDAYATWAADNTAAAWSDLD